MTYATCLFFHHQPVNLWKLASTVCAWSLKHKWVTISHINAPNDLFSPGPADTSFPDNPLAGFYINSPEMNSLTAPLSALQDHLGCFYFAQSAPSHTVPEELSRSAILHLSKRFPSDISTHTGHLNAASTCCRSHLHLTSTCWCTCLSLSVFMLPRSCFPAPHFLPVHHIVNFFSSHM